jgi:Zn finger protein HypA/HybF involved in hydrogenase expression
MHEQATIKDLVATVLHVAAENDAKRVVRIKVKLGALSHFTPEHFEEHWVDAAAGTIAEGCKIEADLRGFVGQFMDLSNEELTLRCEQAIRNYDPCISCATHFLTLEIERT